MIDKIIKDGKVILDELKKNSLDYKPPKRNKKGKVNFKAFANQFGHQKSANIATPMGHVEISVNSQFWKMLKAKENRSNLLFNIKDTLKNPMFVTREDGSYKFICSFRKKNGTVFSMLSVCTRDANNNLILKTSYQIRDISVIKKLAQDRGEVLYERVGVGAKIANNINTGWERFDAAFPHLKDATKEEKVTFAYKAIITLENEAMRLKKDILALKQSVAEPNVIEKMSTLKSKAEKNSVKKEAVEEALLNLEGEDQLEEEAVENSVGL